MSSVRSVTGVRCLQSYDVEVSEETYYPTVVFTITAKDIDSESGYGNVTFSLAGESLMTSLAQMAQKWWLVILPGNGISRTENILLLNVSSVPHVESIS